MIRIFRRTLEIYRLTYFVEDDYLWGRYVIRPIAAFFLSVFHAVPWKPNQITALSLFSGLAASACFAFYPGAAGLWVAYALAQFSFTVDNMDGMMARYSKMHSPAGLKFDFLTDQIKTVFFVPAIGYRVFLETGEMWPIWLCMVGIPATASGLGMTTFIRSPEFTGDQDHSKRPQKTGGTRGLVMSFFSFLGHYPSWIIFPVIFGRMDVFLVIYIAIYAGYAALTYFRILVKICSPGHYRPPEG